MTRRERLKGIVVLGEIQAIAATAKERIVSSPWLSARAGEVLTTLRLSPIRALPPRECAVLWSGRDGEEPWRHVGDQPTLAVGQRIGPCSK